MGRWGPLRPERACGVRALKTHASAGVSKPSAGLSEANSGVGRHHSARRFSRGACVACRMPHVRRGGMGGGGVRIRSQGVLLHVRFVGGMRACTCHAHARRSVSAHDGQLHRRTDWAGHSARKPPWIAAPHPHTPCACVSAKVGVACVQTGPCVPRPLRVPRAPHARSACTEPPIAHDDCGHWAVFSILIIATSMPSPVPVG